MRRLFVGQLMAGVSIALAGCLPSIDAFKTKASVTGTIDGTVVNSKGRPVAGAKIRGIYSRDFVVIIPPAEGLYVVASTQSDPQGKFTLKTSKRVHRLNAYSPDSKLSGELDAVTQSNNIIKLRAEPLYKGTGVGVTQ